jgi:hypothetical protein
MERPTVTYPEPATQGSPEWWPYAREFPHWRVWRGISGLVFARRVKPDPTALVHGEDAVDLRDQIRRAEISG